MTKTTYKNICIAAVVAVGLSACGGGGSSDANKTSSAYDGDVPAQPVNETIVHNGTLYGSVVSPKTGRVWLDRNLGAQRVCTSATDELCFGDLYQFGRGYDGHQDRHSGVIRIRETSLEDTGPNFVAQYRATDGDWYDYSLEIPNLSAVSQRDKGAYYRESKERLEQLRKAYVLSVTKRVAIWRRTDGSSICPVGYQVPTTEEVVAEDLRNRGTGSHPKSDYGYTKSVLKLPIAGSRNSAGDILGVGENTWLALATQNSTNGGWGAYLLVEKAGVGGVTMNSAYPVRCIRAK